MSHASLRPIRRAAAAGEQGAESGTASRAQPRQRHSWAQAGARSSG